MTEYEIKSMSLKELNLYANSLSSENELLALIDFLEKDNRKTVKKLAVSIKRKITLNLKLEAKYKNLKAFDNKFIKSSDFLLAGIDEVGRGPLAGPVVTAAVILNNNSKILEIDDSKKIPKTLREELAVKITNDALSYKISLVDSEVIDEINILRATKKAMIDSINALTAKPDLVIIDAVDLNSSLNLQTKSIIRGDEQSYSIAAASILAKVYRDNLMFEYHEKYPEYGFDTNMGYGTKAHIEAIKKYGLTPIHRKSFVKNIDIKASNTNVAKGRFGEDMAIKILISKGHKIIERNYKRKTGEIDIISISNNLIVFTEVKARKNTDFGNPSQAVNFSKQKHIVSTANTYLLENNLNNLQPRFDVIEIIGFQNKKLAYNHIESAFNAELFL